MLVDTKALWNVTLSFSTVSRNSVLFRRRSKEAILILKLLEGHLQASLNLGKEASVDGVSRVLELPKEVADGDWHTVEVALAKDRLLLRLHKQCHGENCGAEDRLYYIGVISTQHCDWKPCRGRKFRLLYRLYA